ncbi:hypothetical protein [Streptosporangium oxazolinicum]
MDDNEPYAREIAERMLWILRAYPDVVQVGDASSYGKREGVGIRISFDVSLPPGAQVGDWPRQGPEWADAERTGPAPGPPVRRGPSAPRRELPPPRRELPPGRGRS